MGRLAQQEMTRRTDRKSCVCKCTASVCAQGSTCYMNWGGRLTSVWWTVGYWRMLTFLLRWHHLGSDWPSFLRARVHLRSSLRKPGLAPLLLHCGVQQVEAGTQNEALKRTCWIMHGCVKERIFISLLLPLSLPFPFAPVEVVMWLLCGSHLNHYLSHIDPARR